MNFCINLTGWCMSTCVLFTYTPLTPPSFGLFADAFLHASLWGALLPCSKQTSMGSPRKPPTAAFLQIPPPPYPSAGRSPGTEPPAGISYTGIRAHGISGDPDPQNRTGLGRSTQGWGRRRRQRTAKRRKSGERGRAAMAPGSRRRWPADGQPGWYLAGTLQR